MLKKVNRVSAFQNSKFFDVIAQRLKPTSEIASQ